MIKAKHITLGLLATLALTSCGSTTTPSTEEPEVVDKIGDLLSALRKGYTVNGEIKQTNRFYTNDDYDVINSTLGTTTEIYRFDYTYQNSEASAEQEAYTGIDRNLYYMDGETPRMILDDNLFNKNNAVFINALYYDNTIEASPAGLDMEENPNYTSYGASGLINPFLNIFEEDVTKIGENAYSFNNDKISEWVLDMFVEINDMAFASPVNRNIFSLDDEGTGIKQMFIYLDEFKTTLTDGDAYNNIYCGQTFTISLSFTDEGVANAKDKLVTYDTKPENAPLRKIFDKMEGQKLKTTRKDVTIYDGIEHTENYETIVNYFDGEKILYQVYDSAQQAAPTQVTSSDFLLRKDENGLMYPWGRNADGTWGKAGQFNRVGGFPYESYLPIIGDISENIFTLDKATGIYNVPEYLAFYFPMDGCLIPTIVVSSATYLGYANGCQVKLKDNGDIEWVRITCYFDAGSYIQEGYYEMTYEYGDHVKMPYNIDAELEAMEGAGK